MNISIVDQTGRTPQQAVHDLLEKVVAKLKSESGKQIQLGIAAAIRRHFSAKYPGSKHYAPKNVKTGTANGATGEVVVDVPGVTRAYHDLTIKPKTAKKLKIPLHRQAYGMSDANLKYVKTESGAEFLARIEADGALAFMYVLKDQVHQKQDPSLMPTDQTMANAAGTWLAAWLDRTKI